MRKNKVEVIEGTGVLKSPNAVEVKLGEGGARTLETRNVIVATGGRARAIPGVEVDGERVLTYREAIVLRELPASAVIVGAGPIGMEFAHVWSTYGAEVTVVEMLPRAVPLEDEEISKEVERAFKRRKVRVLTSTRVQGVEITRCRRARQRGRRRRGAGAGGRTGAGRHRRAAQQRGAGPGGDRRAGGAGQRRGG